MLLQRRRNSHISLTTLDQRRPNNPVRLLAFDKGPHIRRAGITSTGYGHRLANRGEGTAQDAITRVTAGEQFQRLAQARNCVPPINKQCHRARRRGCASSCTCSNVRVRNIS